MDIGKIKFRRAGIGIAIFLSAMALVAGAFRIAQSERNFELSRWDARLRAGSVQPAARVSDWLADSRRQLGAVALNPTVQIYLSELAAANFDQQGVAEGQAKDAFLMGYIASLSRRGAFASSLGRSAFVSGTVRSITGLAVLDAHRRVVASTFGYTPPPGLVADLMAAMKNGSAGPQASRSGGAVRSAFLVAVMPLQANGPTAPIGYVVGERMLEGGFWASDGSPLAIDGGHESLVEVGRDGATILLGSSLADSAWPSPQAGEFSAARAPLRLQSTSDFSGKMALHLGVPLKSAPWVLIESVPAKNALAGVDERIRTLIIILLLSLAAILAAILVLWRHNAEVRLAEARAVSVKLYRGVTELLLLAIDQRDPSAAAHSRRVAALSREVAVRLGAKAERADTVELAGALLNVGKLFVPAALLTKSEALDETERRQFDEGSTRWLDLLAGMPFDLPLAPILRTAHCLIRRDVEPAAVPEETYIIVAANMAVALVSPRAYRPAHSVSEAMRVLSTSVVVFPERVLDALGAVLERYVSDISLVVPRARDDLCGAAHCPGEP